MASGHRVPGSTLLGHDIDDHRPVVEPLLGEVVVEGHVLGILAEPEGFEGYPALAAVPYPGLHDAPRIRYPLLGEFPVVGLIPEYIGITMDDHNAAVRDEGQDHF